MDSRKWYQGRIVSLKQKIYSMNDREYFDNLQLLVSICIQSQLSFYTVKETAAD